MTRDDLLQEYLVRVPLDQSSREERVVIGLVGVVGSGKSTVARELARRTGLYIASNDSIRRFLNEKGFHGTSPIQETLQYIAEANTKYLLEHNISHIIDNDLLLFHDMVRMRAKMHGFTFYLIKVECAEDVILQRLRERTEAIEQGAADTLSRASVKDYEARKRVHDETPRPNFDFTVHTDQPFEPQLDTLVRVLHLCLRANNWL